MNVRPSTTGSGRPVCLGVPLDDATEPHRLGELPPVLGLLNVSNTEALSDALAQEFEEILRGGLVITETLEPIAGFRVAILDLACGHGVTGANQHRSNGQIIRLQRTTAAHQSLAFAPAPPGKKLRRVTVSSCCDSQLKTELNHGLEHPVSAVPGPDARQHLGIAGDVGVTEAGIEMALVGCGEDGVEAPVEEERDGVVQEAVMPLIGCLYALGLRDTRTGMPSRWRASSRTPPDVCDATRTSAG